LEIDSRIPIVIDISAEILLPRSEGVLEVEFGHLRRGKPVDYCPNTLIVGQIYMEEHPEESLPAQIWRNNQADQLFPNRWPVHIHLAGAVPAALLALREMPLQLPLVDGELHVSIVSRNVSKYCQGKAQIGWAQQNFHLHIHYQSLLMPTPMQSLCRLLNLALWN
jgi:hypothetical protein